MRFFIGAFFFQIVWVHCKIWRLEMDWIKNFLLQALLLGSKNFLVLIFWFNSSKQPFSIKSLTSILLCSFSSEKKNRFFEKIHSLFLPCNFAWKRKKSIPIKLSHFNAERTEKGSLQYADNSTPISGATLGICKLSHSGLRVMCDVLKLTFEGVFKRGETLKHIYSSCRLG